MKRQERQQSGGNRSGTSGRRRKSELYLRNQVVKSAEHLAFLTQLSRSGAARQEEGR